MALKIKLLIDGTERQGNVLEGQMQIERNAHGKMNFTTFVIDDPTNAISLTKGKDLIIEDFDDSNIRQFGGILTEATGYTYGLGRRFDCKALGWSFLLDRALVNFTYRGKSDQFIITDGGSVQGAGDGIFSKSETDLSDFTVSTANVQIGNGNTQFMQFKRVSVRDILDTLKDMASVKSAPFAWDVDPFKTLYYDVFGTRSHAFHMSDAPDDSNSFGYMGLRDHGSITKLVNQVTVEGAFLRELFADIPADGTGTVFAADGTAIGFSLKYLWQASTGNTRIKIFQNNGADAGPPWGTEAEKTVGLAGSDTLSSHDTLWDPAARTLDWATAPPNKTNSFRIEGDRLRPMIARVKDQPSIDDLGRIYGLSIKDVTILSVEHARLRGRAILEKDRAARLSFRTTKDGINPGQNLGMVNSILGIGSASVPKEYLVDKVTTRILGGQVAEYGVNLTGVV